MKKIILLLLGCTLLFTAFSQAPGDYRSKTSGDWNVAGSWERYNGSGWVNAPAAPSSTDGVITILSGHTITNTAAVTVDQLVVSSGGTLVQTSNMTVNNGSGIDLNVNGSLNITGGTISGAGNANISGTVNWSAGTLGIPAILSASAIANLTGYEEILTSTLTNNGTINWSSFYFSFNGGTLVNNKNINNSSDGNLFKYGAGGIINNNIGATFKKLTGTATTYLSVDMNNTGTMDIQTGSFEVSSDTFTTSSNVNIAAGAAFRNSFVSIFNSGSTVSGAGVFHENNGTLLLNNAIILASSITLNISGGNISGSGSLNIAGPVNWSGGTLSVPATFTNTVTANLTGYEEVLASTLTNNGTINWSGVYLSFNGGVLVNNKNINNIGDGNIYRYSGGVINNNSGATFKKLTATGNTLVSVDINNTGTMDIQSGSFEISSDTFTTNSNVNIAAGATFKNSSVSIFTGGSTITGAGTLHQNNGTLTLNSAISLASSTILNISGGNINGTGSLNIAGLVNWSGGTVSVPTTFASTVTANLTGYEVVIANTLTNNGTINWSGTYLSFNGGTLANNKDINNTSDGIFYRYLGGIINNNSGATFRKLAATGSTFSGVDINNTGTIDIQSGTFDISSDTFTTSSNVNIAAGATFKNTHVSVFNSGSSISGAGTFNHSGLTVTLNTNLTIPANIAFNVFTGTINGTGSLKVNGNMEWDGGSLAIPTTFQSSSVINLNTFEVVVASTITNNGIINWHTAYLSFSSGTLINNRTFNITDDNQMYNYGAGSFTNAVSGVITKTSTGITTIGIPLTNNGTIKGVGTYSFGTGLLNNKGIFAPGSSIGILTTGVDYTNKTLEIEMLNGSGPGTGHDQLAVNGKVKLKDTLKISRTGVVPKGNYTILTATGSVSGVFDTIIAPAGYLVTKVGKTMRVTVPDPGVTIKDTIITEGNAGTKQIRFVVNLAFPSNLTGTVDYQTVDSTATVAGNDYVAKSGTLTFTPGKVADTISINVKGDTLTEADEVFYVKLLNPVNLVIAKEKGIGTIINNDGLALFAGSGFNGDAISAAGKPSASSLIVPNLLHRNQQWTINGLTENNTVTIINSQGISVFRETNYKNNTNLSQLAAGLYYYQILVQDKNGKPAIYKGKLVIL